MKRIASISFAFLMLMQSVVPSLDLCCELEKLPSLIAHYTEHEVHDGMSVVDFLMLHYGESDHRMTHHHDDAHDDELPFQGDHQCHHAPMYCTIEQRFALQEVTYPESAPNSQYAVSMTAGFYHTPFQPPKA